jgi:hypothetical protein
MLQVFGRAGWKARLGRRDMGSGNQGDREAAERATHEETERRLLDEAQRMVEYLERALEAAPEDEQLCTRMREIVEQARVVRDRIAHALERARRPDQGEDTPGTG